jgi:hypothetical protein
MNAFGVLFLLTSNLFVLSEFAFHILSFAILTPLSHTPPQSQNFDYSDFPYLPKAFSFSNLAPQSDFVFHLKTTLFSISPIKSIETFFLFLI